MPSPREPRKKVSAIDPIWTALRQQAEAMAGREPTLAGFVHATILQHDRLEQALSYHLARKLGGEDLSPLAIREMFDHAMAADDGIALLPVLLLRGHRRLLLLFCWHDGSPGRG